MRNVQNACNSHFDQHSTKSVTVSESNYDENQQQQQQPQQSRILGCHCDLTDDIRLMGDNSYFAIVPLSFNLDTVVTANNSLVPNFTV